MKTHDDVPSRLNSALKPFAGQRNGLAVSGGSDSVALLCASLEALEGTFCVATVDHGLRQEAKAEAEFVADFCSLNSLAHQTLTWRWDNQGNLSQAARLGRYSALASWAKEVGLEGVLLGHTKDDVAETFLMRLSRGSGVDGLAHMARQFSVDGVQFQRPLLDFRRAELQNYLRNMSQSWVTDQSNEDPKYERVKIRKAIEQLEALDFSIDGLVTSAEIIGKAKNSFAQRTLSLAEEAVVEKFGCVEIDRQKFLSSDPELARRLLLGALRWVSSSAFAPRREAFSILMDEILEERVATLHGCIVVPGPESIWIARERDPIASSRVNCEQVWDNRWSALGPRSNQLEIRALDAEGLAQTENWRDQQLPRKILLSLPAIWDGEELVASPISGTEALWQFELRESFQTFLQNQSTLRAVE